MANCHLCAGTRIGRVSATTNYDDRAERRDECDGQKRRLWKKLFHHLRLQNFFHLCRRNIYNFRHMSTFPRKDLLRWLAHLLQWGPGKDEVFGACIAKTNGRLHLVAGASDVDDDPFTKDGMFHVVTDTQTHL